MKRSPIIIILIILFGITDCFAQVDEPVKPRYGIAAGFNYFPAVYFPTRYKAINNVFYGYHVGGYAEFRHINLRTGLNINYYVVKRYGTSRIQHYTFGIEIGVEKPLLAKKRKWLINPGINFYSGTWWTLSYFSPTNSYKTITKDWEIGPTLLVGRKINDRWTITTESSVGWGVYTRSSNGVVFERQFPSVFVWKFLGIGIRYTL